MPRAPMQPASPASPNAAFDGALKPCRSEPGSDAPSWCTACTASSRRNHALSPMATRALLRCARVAGSSLARWSLRAARSWSPSSPRNQAAADAHGAPPQSEAPHLVNAARMLPVHKFRAARTICRTPRINVKASLPAVHVSPLRASAHGRPQSSARELNASTTAVALSPTRPGRKC